MARPTSPAAYVRISKDPEGVRLGVTRQREDLLRLADRHGWGEPVFYEDNDISASKGKRREQYEQMRADVESGLRDGVLVYSLDRLTRRLSELEGFIEWAERVRVSLANLEGDDLSTANGRMTARIKGAVAQQEAERIGERVKRARLKEAQDGKFPVLGHRAYGYELGGQKVIPAEAERLNEGAQAILSGESPNSLALRWNREGVPTVSGKPWSRTTVRRMLVNPLYVSRRVYSYEDKVIREHVTEEFPGKWPRIFDDETHHALVDKLANPDAKRPQGWNARKYLLAGFAYCECGSLMVARPHVNRPGAKQSARYACVKERHGCGKVARSTERVDEMVRLYMIQVLEREQIEPAVPEESNDLGERIAKAGQKIEDLREKYFLDDDDPQKLSDEDYFPMLRKAREALNALRDQQDARLKSSAKSRISGPGAAERWKKWDLGERRAAVDQYVSQVVIKRVGRVGKRFVPEAIDIIPKDAD